MITLKAGNVKENIRRR